VPEVEGTGPLPSCIWLPNDDQSSSDVEADFSLKFEAAATVPALLEPDVQVTSAAKQYVPSAPFKLSAYRSATVAELSEWVCDVAATEFVEVAVIAVGVPSVMVLLVDKSPPPDNPLPASTDLVERTIVVAIRASATVPVVMLVPFSAVIAAPEPEKLDAATDEVNVAAAFKRATVESTATVVAETVIPDPCPTESVGLDASVPPPPSPLPASTLIDVGTIVPGTRVVSPVVDRVIDLGPAVRSPVMIW